MNDEARVGLSVDDYSVLGVAANPFLRLRDRRGETPSMSLEIQSETNKVLALAVNAGDLPRGRAVWVEKSDQVNSSFTRASLIQLEKTLIADSGFGVLPAYTQLFSAKVGRVRSILNVVAERLSTTGFSQTLAVWMSSFIDAPDQDLPEWEAVSGEIWDEFVAAFAKDPLAAIESVFGPDVVFRELNPQMPNDMRPVSMEEEPEETDDSPEEDALTAAIPEDGSEVPEAEEPPAADELLSAYFVSYMKAHVSPVIARGLRQYRTKGAGALSDELKITKAPRKTLAKLIAFARLRFSKVLVLVDGFDGWITMPDDLRAKYIAALTELRLAHADGLLLVFLVGTGEAPELEDEFGLGVRILWDYPNIATIVANESGVDAGVLESWIARAALSADGSTGISLEALAPIVERAGDSLEAFCVMAAAAVDDAAARGVGSIDAASIEAGLAAAVEA